MAYTILIVDDEPALQRLLGEILTQAGYRIETAGSCQEARSRFQQAAPDAVLLDVMLPDGDGFSLLGDLRRERDLPVLFLSARDEDEARLRGLGLGADDYITKPFLPQELLLRLGAVLRRVYRERGEETSRLGEVEILWGKSALRRGGHALPFRHSHRPDAGGRSPGLYPGERPAGTILDGLGTAAFPRAGLHRQRLLL